MDKVQIDFKFAKNWKVFTKWYETQRSAPMWDIQEMKIQSCFMANNGEIVNWKQLWKEFRDWYKKIYAEKKEVLWSEQKRQIETLMLGQLAELNKEQFILVFLNRGKADTDGQVMSYWEALRVRANLMGDSNGRGGDEDLDKITVVNLKNLIQ